MITQIEFSICGKFNSTLKLEPKNIYFRSPTHDISDAKLTQIGSWKIFRIIFPTVDLEKSILKYKYPDGISISLLSQFTEDQGLNITTVKDLQTGYDKLIDHFDSLDSGNSEQIILGKDLNSQIPYVYYLQAID